MIDKKAKKRFWNKVDKTPGFGIDGDCWEWTAYKNRDGYGHFKLNNKTKLAHRLSWMIEHDKDPGELNVNHTCDNPACVNPDHLWLGTQKEGVEDKMKKERQARQKR